MRPAAVIGWPMEATASPRWQRQRLGGRAPRFLACRPVPPLSTRGLRRVMAGLSAANVTSPYKDVAFAAADISTAAARRCRAANLLTWRGHRLLADNTDLPAFGRALRLWRAPRGEWRVLGTGGAARAAAAALAARGDGPALVSRDPGARSGFPVEGYEQAARAAIRLAGVVNATSVGDPPFDPAALPAGALAVELAYGEESAFLAAARGAGVRAVDGWGHFVAQARLSAREWRA